MMDTVYFFRFFRTTLTAALIAALSACGSDSSDTEIIMPSVVDGQWGMAEEIDSAIENAFSPQISSDPSGNAIAVWTQKHEGQYRVWSNRYNQKTDSWSSPSLIENTATGGSALYPVIALDKNGNGLAVWKQEQANTYSSWSSRYDVSDDTWSASVLIGIDGVDVESVAFSEVVFDAQGNGIAVWNQTDWEENAQVDNIWANRYSVIDNSWGTPVAIDQADNDTYEPKIAVDKHGNALVVWHQRDGGVKSVWANDYSVINSSWGTAAPIELGAGDAKLADGVDNAKIAMDAAGNGIAVWSQYDGTEDSIWVNHYDFSAKEWAGASLIENDTGVARAPKIAIDSHRQPWQCHGALVSK
jgi:hypothetical protein